ncbi:hypothetical protein [Devosia sp. MC1541]|uniref:hypothetical protein n=1 Tax=Devosia sp. MC1541 TaxID=2725264 RepID=UPI00145DEF88|nr:hypothetical protein [Devosia sp. MC1541]
MTDDRPEISIFDVAEWLWSFRWLMLACAVAAVIWAAVAWQMSTRASAPAYEIKLQIFSGGTPGRPPGEVADILAAGLSDSELVLVSAPSANPVVFRTVDRQRADRVSAEVATLADAIISEARARESELERLLPTNENALPQYLSTKAFVDGVNSDLVPLIVTNVGPVAVSMRSPTQAILIPVLACGCLFLLIAGAITFVGEWWKWRTDR